MDNNQNFGGQPQQPVNNNPYEQPQQPVNNSPFGQPQQPVNNGSFGQPQQPVNNGPFGQPQQPVNNGPFGQQYAQPKQPSNINMFELISIICSGVGCLMVFFGTIFTCTCSASKSVNPDTDGLSFSELAKLAESPYKTSLISLLTIFGIIIAAAGIVCAILAMKQTDAPVKAGKLSKVSAIIGIAAVIFGILPLVTICGYNCSLNSAYEDSLKDSLGSLEDWFK